MSRKNSGFAADLTAGIDLSEDDRTTPVEHCFQRAHGAREPDR